MLFLYRTVYGVLKPLIIIAGVIAVLQLAGIDVFGMATDLVWQSVRPW